MPFTRLTERATRSGSKVRRYSVAVSTMDADLKFDDIEHKATGKDLFELICRTLGLRETWFFGLKYTDSVGDQLWLRHDKRIVDQDVPCKDCPRTFQFLVKLYPEDVSQELIQDMTQHLFYLQIKQSILNMDLFCPPEVTVLLAAYSLQAKYGDYDETMYNLSEVLTTEELLPQRVLDQYQMSPELWRDKIREWYSSFQGIAREDAEMEYMKIAERLEMFAVNYFKIKNKKGTDLWLGVTTRGINIYQLESRLHPKVTFPWSEIRNVAYNDKRFIIKHLDKKASDLVFISTATKPNKLILEMCEGNHELFMRRRKPESVEVQQMRAQSREERIRRKVLVLNSFNPNYAIQSRTHSIEREQLLNEKRLREQAEREREELEEKFRELQEEYTQTREALDCSEKAADLLAEKVQIAEEECSLLNRKAAEAEAEKMMLQKTAAKTEEEKMVIEMRAREAERLASRIVEEFEQRMKENQQLKAELAAAHLAAEKSARERCEEYLRGNVYRDFGAMNYRPGDPDLITSDLLIGQSVPRSSPLTTMGNDSRVYDLRGAVNADVDTLSREIEKERAEYMEKSRTVQEQLIELQSEIKVLKDDDKATPPPYPSLPPPLTSHPSPLQLHRSVHSAPLETNLITMMKNGTAKSRVQFFEDL